jgi:hypothetical protein
VKGPGRGRGGAGVGACSADADGQHNPLQTGTHVPTVEVAAGGIKVSCGEVRGEEEKGLHYVEYLW